MPSGGAGGRRYPGAALPEGGETLLTFPNSPLSYAVTWFGMALALVGVYAAWVFSTLRGRGDKQDAQ